MPDLPAMLERGPVVCAEGYLFECERRGYLQAGAFVPEVVLDHPEVVEELHREFVHAGLRRGRGLHLLRPPAEAAGHRQGGHPRAAEPAGPVDRGQGGQADRDAAGGQHLQHQRLRAGDPGRRRGPGRVRGAGGVGRRGGRGHDHRRDVQLAGRGAAGPGGDPGGRPAGGGDLRRRTGTARCATRPARRRPAARRSRPGPAWSASTASGGRGPCCRCSGGSATRCPARWRRCPCPTGRPRRSRRCRPCAIPGGAARRPSRPRSTPSPAPARSWASSRPPRSRSAYATWASAAAPHRITSARWPRRRARSRRPPAIPRTCRKHSFLGTDPGVARAYQEYAGNL